MALPTIVINSAGSNTAASGAGPSTAVSGVLAATHSNTTVNITDAINLGGVSTAGDAVLWVGSSSGRQFSKITAISGSSGNWTVTVAVAYANTESGKNWGIGGKRATIAGSTALFNSDWALGWTVDIQTAETIGSTVIVVAPTPDNTSPPPVITSTTFTTWGTQPLLDSTTNSLVMFKVGTTGLIVRNLRLKQTSGTPGIAFQSLAGTGTNLAFSNLICDGFSQAFDGSNNVGNLFNRIILYGSEVKNCTGAAGSTSAISFNSNAGLAAGMQSQVINCYIHDNVGALFNAGDGMHVINNVFANNSGTGPINIQLGNSLFVNNSVFNCGTGTTNSALAGGSGTPGIFTLANNIFYGNAGYGVGFGSGSRPAAMVNQNNAYGGNNGAGTGLDTSNVDLEVGKITLTANPWNSGTDFGLNSTSGGGPLCKGAAAGVPNASANTAGDLGAIPSGGGAAAGGLLVNPQQTGGQQ